MTPPGSVAAGSGGPSGGGGPTRRELQRVATHVLARARAAHGGRFGLRALPSGIGTPPFGPDETVLRLAGTTLVRERQGADGRTVGILALSGRSLADAAGWAGVDLAAPFSPGHDAPGVGEAGAPLDLDPEAAGDLLAWFTTGARALDALLPGLSDPTAAQLWPEHFDLALAASTRSGGVTFGASPGDDGVPAPYVYVAPWEDGRPGDPGFWNAPFGAVATRAELAGADPADAATAFFRRGLELLGPTRSAGRSGHPDGWDRVTPATDATSAEADGTR